MDSFALTFDHAQKRISRPEIATLMSCLERSESYVDDAVHFDEATGTAILSPLPFTEAYKTTFTGNYARLKKSDFTLTTSAGWTDSTYSNNSSDYVLHSLGINESVKTNFNFNRNEGVYIKIFNYAGSTDKTAYVELGWTTDAADPEAFPISLRVKYSGGVEVYRWGVFQKEYSVTQPETPTEGKQGVEQGWFDFCIMFGRRREMLFLPSTGGGFRHVFEEFGEDETDNEFHAAMPFWLQVKSDDVSKTPQTDVQFNRLRFETSGVLYFKSSYFLRAPEAGLTEDDQIKAIYQDGSLDEGAVRLVEPDDVNTDFVPDGEKIRARLRVDLSGDGTTTPFVYGARFGWKAELTDTDSSEAVDLDDLSENGRHLVGAAIEVPENADGYEITVSVVGPFGSDEGQIDIKQAKELCNRPAKIEIGLVQLMDGRAGAPEYDESTSDSSTVLTWKIGGFMRQMENHVYRDDKPLDGMYLTDALHEIAEDAGISPMQIDIEALDYLLPGFASPSGGEWSVLIERGDTALYWWNKLIDDHAQGYFHGEVPAVAGTRLVFRSPETEPVMTLYSSTADAETEGGFATLDEQRTVVYQEESVSVLEPEANEFWVIGIDPRTLKPIAAAQIDEAAQDVDTVPSARPANWWGEPRPAGLFDGTVRNSETAENIAQTTLATIGQLRKSREIRTEFNMFLKEDGVPLWRGDCVELFGEGDFIVVAGPSTEIELEPEGDSGRDAWFCRPSVYVLQPVVQPI